MSIRVISHVNSLVIDDGNDVRIDFSAWDRKANRGEGGYDLGSIFIESKNGFITIKVKTREHARKGLVKFLREIEK